MKNINFVRLVGCTWLAATQTHMHVNGIYSPFRMHHNIGKSKSIYLNNRRKNFAISVLSSSVRRTHLATRHTTNTTRTGLCGGANCSWGIVLPHTIKKSVITTWQDSDNNSEVFPTPASNFILDVIFVSKHVSTPPCVVSMDRSWLQLHCTATAALRTVT